MNRILSTCVLLFLLVSCASTSTESSINVSRPNIQTSTSESAEVIVMWAENASLQTVGVSADGTEIGRLRKNRLVRVRLSPGVHELKAKFVGVLGIGMPSAKFKLKCDAGARHYVLFTYDYQMTGAVPVGSLVMIMGSPEKRFEEIHETRAKEIIAFAGIY